MGNTTNTLLLLQVSTRLLLWPIREAKSQQHNNGLSIRVLDLLFHPQLHQIEVGLPSELDQEFQVCVEPRKQRYQRQNWLELPQLQAFQWRGRGLWNGNLLREYNLPGMLVKMHACAVSVYQALSKEPGYEAIASYPGSFPLCVGCRQALCGVLANTPHK